MRAGTTVARVSGSHPNTNQNHLPRTLMPASLIKHPPCQVRLLLPGRGRLSKNTPNPSISPTPSESPEFSGKPAPFLFPRMRRKCHASAPAFLPPCNHHLPPRPPSRRGRQEPFHRSQRPMFPPSLGQLPPSLNSYGGRDGGQDTGQVKCPKVGIWLEETEFAWPQDAQEPQKGTDSTVNPVAAGGRNIGEVDAASDGGEIGLSVRNLDFDRNSGG